MSFHFRPDKILQERAVAKLRKMFLWQSFMERWDPVAKELKWVIGGRMNEEQHQKILPDYCYHILDLWKRTTFKGFVPISEAIIIQDRERAATCKTIQEAKEIMVIHWDKLGQVFSIGERGMMFFENEAEQKLEQDGLLDLTPDQDDDVSKLIFGQRWMEKRKAEIEAQEPGKPFEEIIVERLFKIEETTKQAVPDWHQRALEWDPEAVTKFHEGVAKGSNVFLDKDGDLSGEGKIKLRDTYEFLLIAWPEIEEMLKSNPPKTRNHLWDWLITFSFAGWIEIRDLEQLNRLCSEIQLKLKKPGAPLKTK
jgi:hypothetical protein